MSAQPHLDGEIRNGRHIMPVRVYRAAEVHELDELPVYAGCRSWVDLAEALPTAGAQAVLEEKQFTDLLRTLDRLHCRRRRGCPHDGPGSQARRHFQIELLCYDTRP